MQSYNFLFWNINMTNRGNEPKNLSEKKANIEKAIKKIVDDYSINFVLLAETQRFDNNQLLKTLNSNNTFRDRNIEGVKRFIAFDNLPNVDVDQKTDKGGRITSLKYEMKDQKILLNLVHLRDKFFNDDSTLSGHARQHADRIRLVEGLCKTENTIVVGDFNLNPYDAGMLEADAFNATMSKTVIKNLNPRVFGEREYKYFFNPSWNLLGKENNQDILGTYYFSNLSQNKLSYWHVLDQLLLRGDILHNLEEETFKIIFNLPGYDIIKDGVPNDKEYSDHLPIIFTLTF